MAAELRPLCGQMVDALPAWSEYAALTTTAIHSPRAASEGGSFTWIWCVPGQTPLNE